MATKSYQIHHVILIKFKYELKLHLASVWKYGKCTLKKKSRQHLRSLQNQSQPNLIIPNPDLNMKGILLHLTFQSVSAICFLNQYIDERIAANSKYRWTDIENTLLIATKTNTHMEKPGGKWLHVWMNGGKVNKWRQILAARPEWQHWSMDIAALTVVGAMLASAHTLLQKWIQTSLIEA